MLRGIGSRPPRRSRGKPSDRPRFGLVSASMAHTGRPRRASVRARSPATVVLPLPPLPAMAILLMGLPLDVPVHTVRRVPRSLALAVGVGALAVAGAGQVGKLVGEAAAAFP